MRVDGLSGEGRYLLKHAALWVDRSILRAIASMRDFENGALDVSLSIVEVDFPEAVELSRDIVNFHGAHIVSIVIVPTLSLVGREKPIRDNGSGKRILKVPVHFVPLMD